MARQLSVAQARDSLPHLIHEVETSGPVEVTRRGRPVAVILDFVTWQRIRPPAPDLFRALQDWRATADLDGEDPVQLFEAARDRDPGPAVDLS